MLNEGVHQLEEHRPLVAFWGVTGRNYGGQVVCVPNIDQLAALETFLKFSPQGEMGRSGRHAPRGPPSPGIDTYVCVT